MNYGVAVPTPHATTGRRWVVPERTWVDLFYDLAFAAGIIALSGSFADDHSGIAVIWYSIAYAMMWCAWLLTGWATGSLTTTQAPHSVASIGLLVTQMAALLLLALVAGDSIVDAEFYFDVLLGVVMVTTLILALRRRRSGPMRWRVPASVAFACLALALSWYVEGTASLVVWLVALASVALAAWSVASDRETDGHRAAHRLGELSVIVIGEVLVKLTLTLTDESMESLRLAALPGILLTLAGVWWIYFVNLPQASRLTGPRRAWWIVLHVPLHLGLLGLAVGLAKVAVNSAAVVEHPTLLTLPIVLTMASLALMAWLAAASWWIPAVGMAALSAVAAVTGHGADPLWAAVAIAAITVATAGGLAITPKRSAPAQTATPASP